LHVPHHAIFRLVPVLAAEEICEELLFTTKRIRNPFVHRSVILIVSDAKQPALTMPIV